MDEMRERPRSAGKTTDNEREMMELAGKAAGLDLVWDGPPAHCDVPRHRGVTGNSPRIWWNPRNDDGDALRLAVALQLEIRFAYGCAHAGHSGIFWESARPGDDGMAAAVRQAVFLAAVKLGRGMP